MSDFWRLLLQNYLPIRQKIDSVKVSDDQVENQLNARFDRVLAYMNNDLVQFEEYYGKSVNEMKDELRKIWKISWWQKKWRIKSSPLAIRLLEVKDYFRSIPLWLLPYYSAEVEYSELDYYPKPNKIERQRVIDKLNSIRQRIVEQGESFEDFTKKVLYGWLRQCRWWSWLE